MSWVELPWPHIDALCEYLYKLAKATVRYWLGLGEYGDITKYQLYIHNWFQALWYKIRNVAEDEANEAQTFLTKLISDVVSALTSIKETANDAAYWIKVTGGLLVAWYGANGSKLSYLVSDGYTFLKRLWRDPYATVKSILGSAWVWLLWFWNDPYNAIRYYTNLQIQWLNWFYTNHTAAVGSWLGRAWTWLQSLYADPYSRITAILGSAWRWLVSFRVDPLGALDSLTGHWLSFTLAVVRAFPNDEISAVRTSLRFWYAVWSQYRSLLWSFLTDPVRFILAVLTDVFLPWLEQLIADNW